MFYGLNYAPLTFDATFDTRSEQPDITDYIMSIIQNCKESMISSQIQK